VARGREVSRSKEGKTMKDEDEVVIHGTVILGEIMCNIIHVIVICSSYKEDKDLLEEDLAYLHDLLQLGKIGPIVSVIL